MDDSTDRRALAGEADFWNRAAEQGSTTPPDWRRHRVLRQNLIRVDAIDMLLDRVRPGMKVVEPTRVTPYARKRTRTGSAP